MLIFVSSNIIKSLKNYVLKVLTTFIHFTKRNEVLLAIDELNHVFSWYLNMLIFFEDFHIIETKKLSKQRKHSINDSPMAY